jgi:hypothetical protein
MPSCLAFDPNLAQDLGKTQQRSIFYRAMEKIVKKEKIVKNRLT